MGPAPVVRELLVLRLRVVTHDRGAGGASPGPSAIVSVPRTEIVNLVAAAVGVIRVIDVGVHLPVQVARRVDHVEHAHTALDRQHGQAELVVSAVAGEAVGAALAVEVRVIGEHPVGLQRLLDVLYDGAPIVVEVVGEAHPSADIVGIVEVVLDQVAVVCGFERARRVDGRCGDIVAVQQVDDRRESAVIRIVEDVVDPASLVVSIAHDAQRCPIGQRQVDEPLLRVADVATLGGGGADLDPRVESGGIGLVGDQAHGAGLGACAIQGALGTGQNLNAAQVRGIDIEVAATEGHRLLVNVQGGRGGRTLDAGNGVLGLFGGCAAYVNLALARTDAHHDDVRQVLDVVVKVADSQLIQGISLEGRNGYGDVLGGFRPLGGRDDDFLDGGRLRRHRACGGHGDGRQHGPVQFAAFKFH